MSKLKNGLAALVLATSMISCADFPDQKAAKAESSKLLSINEGHTYYDEAYEKTPINALELDFDTQIKLVEDIESLKQYIKEKGSLYKDGVTLSVDDRDGLEIELINDDIQSKNITIYNIKTGGIVSDSKLTGAEWKIVYDTISELSFAYGRQLDEKEEQDIRDGINGKDYDTNTNNISLQ